MVEIQNRSCPVEGSHVRPWQSARDRSSSRVYQILKVRVSIKELKTNGITLDSESKEYFARISASARAVVEGSLWR